MILGRELIAIGIVLTLFIIAFGVFGGLMFLVGRPPEQRLTALMMDGMCVGTNVFFFVIWGIARLTAFVVEK